MTMQNTYQPPPLPNGAQWSPSAVPVRFNPTTRGWELFANGQWLPRPGMTFEQVNAMGRAGQAFQVDFAASGGQANMAAVQREIAPRVFAADNAQLSPEGGILAPGRPNQAVATQQRPNPAVFAPDGAQLSESGSILSLPGTDQRRGLPPVAEVAATAPAMAPPPERGNNPTATLQNGAWNVDPGATWDYSGAAPATLTPPRKREPDDLAGAAPPPPRDPNQPPTREGQWLAYLLGSSPAMQGQTPAFSRGGYKAPRYAEGGSQNFAAPEGEEGLTFVENDEEQGGSWWRAPDGSIYWRPFGMPIGRGPTFNPTVRLDPSQVEDRRVRSAGPYPSPGPSPAWRYAEGGAQGPLPMPDAIVGEGLESATPQFDTPERSELTLQPMPNFGPDIFKVRVAEGPTGVQADGGMLVLPLSEPAANIAREHLRPADGIKGQMDGQTFEAGPLSLPTAPGPGGASTPALASGGFAFDLNPPQQQQPQQPPPFEGIPPLDPSQVQRGVLPPQSLAVPDEAWAGLPGGAPPPMGNINDFSKASPAQLARYDQWLKSLGILGGIDAAKQYFDRTAPTRLNLPTVMG